MRLNRIVLLALLCIATISRGQSAPPQRTIRNGLIEAKVYLPDRAHGFYRGTRFDWAGVIGTFTTLGHSFYDPWFTQTDASVNDFIFRGREIVAGACSAITGPAEEFHAEGSPAFGYAEAKAGGTFVKIGVGVLRKPDDAPYDHYRLYDVVDDGKWMVSAKRDAITFTQRVLDPSSGYGYEYRKTVSLVRGKREMLIEHSLKNIGRKPIESRVYDHNFLVLDHQTTGPDFEVQLPYTIVPLLPVDATLGRIDGRSILFKKPIEGEERFTLSLSGFSDQAKDYNIVINNRKANVRVEIQGDRPLYQESMWAIRSVLAVEPFVRLSIAPGETTTWAYRYTYSTLRADSH
jgi:hypothetical protein